MNLLMQFIAQYQAGLTLGLLVTTLICLVVILFLWMSMNQIKRQYRQMMLGSEGQDLEQLFSEQQHLFKEGLIKIKETGKDYQNLKDTIHHCLQGVGIIRYNAFEDVGSDLSFAVALLDRQGNGVVLSSLYAREDTRIYAKPVINGQSSYLLTEEEKKAINIAIQSLSNSKSSN